MKYSSFELITNSTLAAVDVRRTEALFVQTAGVLEVAGANTGMVNFGTVAAGTKLELDIVQVGTANTAVLIALR